MCLLNKCSNSSYNNLSMKTRNKPSRARVDRPVNRIEFNRLQPAVEAAPEMDASAASVAVREKENRSERSGSKVPYLRSAGDESFGSAFKKPSKPLTAKSPQSAPASVDVRSRVKSTPGSARMARKSAKKIRLFSIKRSYGKNSTRTLRRPSSSVPEAFLSAGEAPSFSEDAGVGRSPSPPASDGSEGRAPSPPPADGFTRVADGGAPLSPESLAAAVLTKNGKDLIFDAPYPCVPAVRGGRHEGRGIVVSKVFPISEEQRQDFVDFVEAFDWEDHYWLQIPSTRARELALKHLRKLLAPCSSFLAEKYLQLSYIVHQRFVAGDDDMPAEHFALACAIGLLYLNGEDTYRADMWEHRDTEHPLDGDGPDGGSSSSARSGGRGSPRSAKTGQSSGDNHKRVRVPPPVVPQGDSGVDNFHRALSANVGGQAVQEVVGPKAEECDTAAASYLEQLAAEVQGLTARPNSVPRATVAADQASDASRLAIAKAIEDLRRSKLPPALVEAAIKGLLGANDALRMAPAPAATAPSAADLGRGYRVGALAAEARQHAHHVNRVGARVATGDGPESHWCHHDRLALLNPGDRDVLLTLRKVMRSGGEFSHLNSEQKMKAMARLVRRQLHAAHLEKRQSSTKKVADEAGAAKGAKEPVKDAGDGENSSSSGDSCSESSDDSRGSGDTYQRDSFCNSEGEGDGRGDGDGDGDDGSDGANSSGSEDDLDERDKRRAEKRRESYNSLGTPAAKSRSKVPLASPAPVKPVEGDRPSLVLLGDEDLAMWKSGLRKYKMGFHWESYLYHKQQYDNYKAHRGRYSDRTFKSIIDAKLVPTVCASCGFFRSRWATLSDARLILKIERVLRPSKSTDFAMELKEIKIEYFDNEPLQASYITFAEKFLAKVAEAADAGRPVKPVVVKAAYKAALDKEVPLKTWLEGDKWRGVDHAHKRLLRKLREARSWEAMTASVRRKQQRSTCDDQADGGAENSRQGFHAGGNRRRANATRRNIKKRQSNASRGGLSNASASFGGGGKRDSGHGKSGQRQQAERLRTWKGCDSRGDNWHTDKDLFECFKKPCNASFCQRCAKHGHTADYCRVPDGTEGLNTSGYFQEQRPGKAGPKRPPARHNSSRIRSDAEASSEGESDDGASHSGGKGNTARRSNSSRGQRGRGRL
jgi:hypothetical protein